MTCKYDYYGLCREDERCQAAGSCIKETTVRKLEALPERFRAYETDTCMENECADELEGVIHELRAVNLLPRR